VSTCGLLGSDCIHRHLTSKEYPEYRQHHCGKYCRYVEPLVLEAWDVSYLSDEDPDGYYHVGSQGSDTDDIYQ